MVGIVKKTAAYGTWTSPITAQLVAGQSLRLDQLQTVGDTVCWSELRPAEGARNVVVMQAPGEEPVDAFPAPYSARSRVHEYGGGAYLACEGEIFFINDRDQAVYRAGAGGEVEKIASQPDMRCADMARDPSRSRLLAVGEEHDPDGVEPPENMLVEIALDGDGRGSIEPFISGRDFYASPRFSHDGSRLCWVEWSLPWMPWEDSRLMVGAVGDDGGIYKMEHVAGGDGTSVFQPEWGADGRLYFVCDRTSWGNLYVWDGEAVSPVVTVDAEFGRPAWGLRSSSYAISGDGGLVAAYIDRGVFRLGAVDPDLEGIRVLNHDFGQIDAISATGDGVAVLATGDVAAPSVLRIRPGEEGVADSVLLRSATAAELDPLFIAKGELVHVPLESSGEVHAIYYPPASGAFAGEPGTAPPLIAAAHGGPTGMADRGLKLKIQYWTSRGFAFVDVDYRGSAGYGTAYRDALNGKWGLLDVEDVIAATGWLVDQGLADGERLLISGGSAGGFTVLCALTFHDVFAAGASYYGIGDLQKLLDLTHKFESGYIYNLTGTAPGKTRDVFHERSPLFHADRISSPVIFFQGIEDKVVPPGQSREMVKALKQRNVPVACMEFEGEGHGFRQAGTIAASLESEYAFYAQVLGLQPMEDLPDIDIHNREYLT